MSNSKPMDYPTLKCLFKYLDPSLRFQLSATCPSIRFIEKSTHMLIKRLELTDNCITVNKSDFKFSVFNRRNHYWYDIDQYGERDSSEIEQDPNELRIDRRYPFASYKSIDKYAPTENFIQLLVRGRVEVLNYQRKMHEAMHYLLGKLFGERTLKVYLFSVICENILRVPLKFKVQNLEIFDVTSLKPSCLLIDESSLPLNTVKLSNISLANCIDPVIQAARMLHLHPSQGASGFWYEPYPETWTELKHKRVHVTFSYFSPTFDILQVVNAWIMDRKEIGTYFTFETCEDTIDEWMESTQHKYDRGVRADFTWNHNGITLKMSETSNLVMDKFQSRSGWNLGMKAEHRRLC